MAVKRKFAMDKAREMLEMLEGECVDPLASCTVTVHFDLSGMDDAEGAKKMKYSVQQYENLEAFKHEMELPTALKEVGERAGLRMCMTFDLLRLSSGSVRGRQPR